MKTIQIPTTSNPFIVNINNHEYQYRAGETIEVPDEVAAAIEDALELEPKPGRNLSKFAQVVERSITEVNEWELEGIEAIYRYAFSYCKGITAISIPNSVKTLDGHAFYSCSKLETVKMGKSITSIGANVFEKCVKLARVYLPETPPSLENVNAFDSVSTTCTFCCKSQESLDAYKAAVNWSTLTGTYSFVVET